MKLQPLFPLAYTKVLVPVDCTPISKTVILQAARAVMPMTGPQITLLATVPVTDGNSPELDKLREARWRHAEEALATTKALLRDYGFYVKTRAQVANNITEALVAETQERPYNLIVIGNHFAHTEEPCDPSEADKLMKALPVPVIVVDSTGK